MSAGTIANVWSNPTVRERDEADPAIAIDHMDPNVLIKEWCKSRVGPAPSAIEEENEEKAEKERDDEEMKRHEVEDTAGEERPAGDQTPSDKNETMEAVPPRENLMQYLVLSLIHI